MIRILQYSILFIGLISLTLAFALQYTHDTTYSECHRAMEHHDDEESCSLCWFVFHQCSDIHSFDVLLPEIKAFDRFLIPTEHVTIRYRYVPMRYEGNKDPPLLV